MHILVLIIVIILLIFLVGKLLEDVAGGAGIVGYAIVKAAQGIASLFKKASGKEKAEKPPRPPKQPKRPAPAEGPTTITVGANASINSKSPQTRRARGMAFARNAARP